MHALLHKSRRENHRWVVFTQQETIYSCAHLVLTNLLITSLLILCFSQLFLLFLPPKFLLISYRPIDSYSDICYLGTDDLIISVSFLWMIWVDLPFLIYLFQFDYFSEKRFQFLLRKFYGILSEKAFPSTCMHFYTKVGEKITGGWCLHSRIRFTRAHT